MVKNPLRPTPSSPYAIASGHRSSSFAARKGSGFVLFVESRASSHEKDENGTTSAMPIVVTPTNISTKLSSLKSCAASSSSSSSSSSEVRSSVSESSASSSDEREASETDASSFFSVGASFGSSSSRVSTSSPSSRALRLRASSCRFASARVSASRSAAATRRGGSARTVTFVPRDHTAATGRRVSYASGPTCTSTVSGVTNRTTSSSHGLTTRWRSSRSYPLKPPSR